MKRTFKRVMMIAIVGAIVLSLSSCLWFLSIGNKFTAGGSDFKIASAIAFDYGELEPGIYGMELMLLGEDVTYNADADEFSGHGPIALLAVASTAPVVAEGTYPVMETGLEEPPVVEIAIFYGPINFDSEDPPEQGWIATSGSLSIAEVLIGDWLLEWSMQGIDMEDADATIEGKYRGEIQIIDYSAYVSIEGALPAWLPGIE